MRTVKNLFKLVAAVLAGLLLTIGLSGTAFAKDPATARAAVIVQPSPNTVGTAQICDRCIGSGDYGLKSIYGTALRDNTVPWLALGSQLRTEIRAAQGPILGNERIVPGTVYPAQLSADAKKQLTYTAQLTEPKLIANIGGPINTQGTHLGLGLQLPFGTYLVTVSGQINRVTAAASPGKQTQPQLSLWLDRNRDGEFTWKTEGDISPNGTIPDLADRSVTVSGQTILTINQSTPLDVDLIAHGYNNDASGAGSGELAVGSAVISAIPIS